ncbi:MAG: hypothetical protein ACP6IU_07440 [Candidatus Asgardarchaeia archaeon]
MIYRFYILDYSGAALFEYVSQHIKTGSFDSQLIAGFIYALNSFSEHIFDNRIQSIDFPDRRLVIVTHPLPENFDSKDNDENNLIAIAFSDILDDKTAVAKLCSTVLKKFAATYKTGHTNPQFEREFKNTLQEWTKDRNYKSLFLGISTTLLTYYSVVFLYSILPNFYDMFPILFSFLLFYFTGTFFRSKRVALLVMPILTLIASIGFIMYTDFIGMYRLSFGFTPRLVFLLASMIIPTFSGYLGGEAFDKRYLMPSSLALPGIYQIRSIKHLLDKIKEKMKFKH